MSQISLQDAARAIAVDYAGSSDEDPNVTQYILRMADRIDELEVVVTSATNTLEDIAGGKGMFGLDDKEDLKWAMNIAGKTAEVIETRMKK